MRANAMPATTPPKVPMREPERGFRHRRDQMMPDGAFDQPLPRARNDVRGLAEEERVGEAGVDGEFPAADDDDERDQLQNADQNRAGMRARSGDAEILLGFGSAARGGAAAFGDGAHDALRKLAIVPQRQAPSDLCRSCACRMSLSRVAPYRKSTVRVDAVSILSAVLPAKSRFYCPNYLRMKFEFRPPWLDRLGPRMRHF